MLHVVINNNYSFCQHVYSDKFQEIIGSILLCSLYPVLNLFCGFMDSHTSESTQKLHKYPYHTHTHVCECACVCMRRRREEREGRG